MYVCSFANQIPNVVVHVPQQQSVVPTVGMQTTDRTEISTRTTPIVREHFSLTKFFSSSFPSVSIVANYAERGEGSSVGSARDSW